MCWPELLWMATNSGHPVALLMMVRACIFSIVVFPGMDEDLYLTSHGLTRSTWTSSQGANL